MILVTGANGQLGSEIREIAGQFPYLNFCFTDVAELDITNEAAVHDFLATHKISHIINCAAYTAVDKAEQEPQLAKLINSDAVGILSRAAMSHHIFLIHISTDYVFDGAGHLPYKENDPTAPVSQYATSKYLGEQQILQFSQNAMIIRTSWLYSSYGHNFVKTIMKYGKERGFLKVVFDQVGTPTYTGDLAKSILHIISSGHQPEGVEIYHFSNEGVCSWYDFALAILEFSGIPCKVLPIETYEYPLPAQRPWYSVFNKKKIKERFQLEIPHWRDSLKICVEKLINN